MLDADRPGPAHLSHRADQRSGRRARVRLFGKAALAEDAGTRARENIATVRGAIRRPPPTGRASSFTSRAATSRRWSSTAKSAGRPTLSNDLVATRSTGT